MDIRDIILLAISIHTSGIGHAMEKAHSTHTVLDNRKRLVSVILVFGRLAK